MAKIVEFPQFFRASDFSAGSTATDITVTSGSYQIVGTKTVGASQLIAFGVGNTLNGVDTRRTAKIRFDSVAGQIPAQYRLAVEDANGLNRIPVYEDNDVNFNTGVALGVTEPAGAEDQKLLLLIKPDSTTIVDYSDSDNNVNMPMTVQNILAN